MPGFGIVPYNDLVALEESLKDKVHWQFKIDFQNLAKYLLDFNFSIKFLAFFPQGNH